MTDGDAGELDLAGVLDAAAEGLDGVTAARTGGATTWSVGPVGFARLDDLRAEFRLDPLVARAALRTPDTTPSERGIQWVAFAPAELDDGAIDRAEAWFLSAFRLASKGR